MKTEVIKTQPIPKIWTQDIDRQKYICLEQGDGVIDELKARYIRDGTTFASSSARLEFLLWRTAKDCEVAGH